MLALCIDTVLSIMRRLSAAALISGCPFLAEMAIRFGGLSGCFQSNLSISCVIKSFVTTPAWK